MSYGKWYALGVRHLNQGDCSWKLGETYKAALLNGLYFPDKDTHELWSDISTFEVIDVGYVQKDLIIADPVYDVNTGYLWFGAADLLWDGATEIQARYLAVFADGGTPETQYLIGFVDFGEIQIAQATPFSIAFNSSGLLRQRIL